MKILDKDGEVMCTISFINADIYYQIENNRVKVDEVQRFEKKGDGYEEWVDTDIIDTETGEVICQFHSNFLYYFAQKDYMIEF